MVRGRIAGAPTPDICRKIGVVASRRSAGTPLYSRVRARATVYGPALQVRGRTAGAPTPDIWAGPCVASRRRGRWAVPPTPTSPLYRLRARPTGYAPALQGGAVCGSGPYSSPTRGSWAEPVRRLQAHVWPKGGQWETLPDRVRGRMAGPYNSPWGAHGLGPGGPFTGPPYRIRARATGRGRVAGAPTPDIWAVERRLQAWGRIIRPGGLTGRAGSSPPGACMALSPYGAIPTMGTPRSDLA
eukprot:gene22079-biopygen17694